MHEPSLAQILRVSEQAEKDTDAVRLVGTVFIEKVRVPIGTASVTGC